MYNVVGETDTEMLTLPIRYITVDKKAGRALFYVLVTSENSAIDDPLVRLPCPLLRVPLSLKATGSVSHMDLPIRDADLVVERRTGVAM